MPEDPVAEETPIDRVRDGVFFTRPEALPRGRHGLTAEQVAAAQRERIMVAVTELLAAGGYRGFGVGEIAARAGISLATLYARFASKDACVFAGYDRFIEVLLARMAAVEVPPGDQTALASALIGAYLHTLQEDLVVARAYQVEIDALGPPARARRRESLTLFAAYIRQRTQAMFPPGPGVREVPETAYIGVVYAARQLAVDALDLAPVPDLAALGADLERWIADVFRPA